MKTKCVKCAREAEYESPSDFCKFHWLLWWFDSETEKSLSEVLDEEEADLIPLLEMIKTDLPENEAEMEKLYEQYKKWIEYED